MCLKTVEGIRRSSTIHQSDHRIWRSSLAWQIAFFLGLQSFLFYVTVAWLPAILIDKGVGIGTAGWLLSFTQFIGLPFSFLVPVLAGRFRSQQWIAVALGLCSLAGFGGLLLDTSFPVMMGCIVYFRDRIRRKFSTGLNLYRHTVSRCETSS